MGNVPSNTTRPSICDESALPAEKWVQWYPAFRDGFVNFTAQCFQELHDHPANNTFYGDLKRAGDHCPNAYDMITCVQGKLPAVLQLNNSSAQVLLGLTPTILSMLSSSVGEISLLSSTRPLLSFLLSIGTPSLYAARPLEYDNPLEVLKKLQDPKSKPSLFSWRQVGPQFPHKMLISAVQYMLVLASAANIMQLGWQLGLQTIVVWKVGSSSMVFLWSTLAAVVHLTAAASWHTSNSMRQVRRSDSQNSDLGFNHWSQLLSKEVTICAAKERRGYLASKREESPFTVLLNLGATLMGVLLIIFGTLTFSSLLFISAIDAFVVVTRYLVSTLACRLVVMFELAGMAAVEAADPDTKEMDYGSRSELLVY